MPTRRDVAPLSAAWLHMLLVGRPAPTRVRGWVELEQAAVRTANGSWSWQDAGDRHWAAHQRELVAAAAEYDFVPYWSRKKRPTGDGFRNWQARFLAEHRY